MTIKLLAILASLIVVYFIGYPITNAIDHYMKHFNTSEE